MTKKRESKRKYAEGGFTLVELMVSLVIFSTVMVISAGTLLIMIDINAKAQAIYSSTTNLSFALDTITREIRTGHHYNCQGYNPPGSTDHLPSIRQEENYHVTSPCTNGNYIAFFREKDGYQIGYRLVQDIEEGTGWIEQRINNPAGSSGDTPWVRLTSEDVVVQNFRLNVLNVETYDENDSDTTQPVVDLFISGYVNNGLDQDTDFSIQSRVVQRRLDII